MAVQAPWVANEELWNSSPTDSFFDAYRKSSYNEAQQLSNELTRTRLKKAAQEQAIQDSVAEKLKAQFENGEEVNYDELPVKMRDLYAQAGDIEKAAGYNEKINQTEKLQHTQDSAELKDLLALKKAGATPEMLHHFAEFYGLQDQVGSIDSLNFNEKPNLHGGLKEGIWTEGDDGGIKILREPTHGDGAGGGSKVLSYVTMIKGGDTKFVDKRAPDAMQQLQTLSASGYKQKPSFLDELGATDEEGPISEGPGLVENMLSLFSGKGDATKQDAAGVPNVPAAPAAKFKNLPPPNPDELGPDGKPSATGRQKYIQRITGGISGM